MGTTPTYQLPYPELTDPADGPDGFKDLAERVETVLKAQATVPTGVIAPFAGAAAPAGWALCNGQALSRTTYAALFAALGTTYGAGDGTTTFNLPNLAQRVPAGLDAAQTEFNALGKTGGARTHTLAAAESGVRNHGHGVNDPGHIHNTGHALIATGMANQGAGTGFDWGPLDLNQFGAYTGISIQGSGDSAAQAAHNNLQPYVVVNYIIKT